MSNLLSALGFSDNPFASYVAENEPDIENYFIRPQYYDTVTERGNKSHSLILFGARGAGKSATRLSYYRNAWSNRKEGRETPLVVILDDFSRILENGLEKVDLGRFVTEIGYLTIEAILIWLANLSEEDRKLYVDTLTKAEEANVIALLGRFYLTRPEIVRNSTVVEPLKLLNQAWHQRSALWLSSRWDSIVKLIGAIAQGITKKATDVDVNLDRSIDELLKTSSSTWNNALYAKAILSRLIQLARTFGFSGITVLVDKVDETQFTNNSSLATASLLYPLLVNTQLLEIEGFGWLLFLWDLVSKPYSSGNQSIRLDKIANATIQWDEAYLRELISQRLKFFSNGRITDFGQLCDSAVDANAIMGQVIRLSMKSPRELIRAMDTIIREHDDEHSVDEDINLLSSITIDRGLDKYTIDTVKRVFERRHLQQVVKLDKPTFINRDVQLSFRINDDAARNRIIGWTDAGIVTQTGTRAAEGSAGGKPAHEYSVVDQRVRRVVERNLSLGSDYEEVDESNIENT